MAARKGIPRQTWPNGADPPEFRTIDSFIDQFSQIDHDCTAFRYPHQKAGKQQAVGKASLQGLRHINLRNLTECVHSLSDFIDGAACGLMDYLDHKYQCELDRDNR